MKSFFAEESNPQKIFVTQRKKRIYKKVLVFVFSKPDLFNKRIKSSSSSSSSSSFLRRRRVQKEYEEK